jgi:chromosome segregation ATPase
MQRAPHKENVIIGREMIMRDIIGQQGTMYGGNVTQNIGTLPADQATKNELTKLIDELHAELEKLSKKNPDRKEEIDAVASSTSELIEKAKPEKPNRTLLQAAINTVKSIAEALNDVAPSVLGTVTAIAGIIAKLHGL